MPEELKCKSLKAIYKLENGVLGGPHKVEFNIIKDYPIHISIEQAMIRTVTITCDQDIGGRKLWEICLRIEQLIMLFDGMFIPLYSLEFTDSEYNTKEHLDSYSYDFIRTRLSYLCSADFCKYTSNKLIEFDKVLTSELYLNWERLLDELDTAHNVFLYSLSGINQLIDIRCAFLIELSEPLVQIVKKNHHYFSSLSPGARGTTLKMCIDALISKYGTDIFSKELSEEYEKLLKLFVNSRIKIMHIKSSKNKTSYLSGEESLIYAAKFYLLYRKIMFEMLDIDKTFYIDSLEKCVDFWNNFGNILMVFFKGLKNRTIKKI